MRQRERCLDFSLHIGDTLRDLEALFVLTDDRFGLHDEERTSPVRPKLGKPYPEYAIALPQPWSFGRMFKNSELLTKREVLGDQFGAISQDVSNQGKKDAKHAHFIGLPGC